MPFVDPRPDDVHPVRVLVDGRWWDDELESYRREPDGRWLGWVRWSEGLAATRMGWFGESELVWGTRLTNETTPFTVAHP